MKHIFKVIIAGICLGIILVFIKEGLQIDDDAFTRYYYWIAAVVVIGAVAVNLVYNISYQNRVRKAAKLLDEEKPLEYLSEIEKLLKSAKGNNLRNVLTLDLAAGYVEIKQFDKAIPMLEELSSKRLTGSAVKVAHQINLCLCYFETEQSEKAMKLYDKSQILFEKYRNGKIYGANIALLDILAAIQDGSLTQAEQILNEAKKKYENPRFQKAFYEVSDVLDEHKEQ